MENFNKIYEKLRNIYHSKLKYIASNIGWKDTPLEIYITCKNKDKHTIKNILKENELDKSIIIKTSDKNEIKI